MAGLDARFVVALDLCESLTDKDSGELLANGYVEFWEDSDRIVPKLVYELSGSPPDYTYTPLPNPIVLSNTGNFQDSAGNNIAVYYFPYDSFAPDANIQLYYIAVFNSDGVEQFTREAWPNTTIDSSAVLTNSSYNNQISNPQFSTVLFNASAGLTISFSGSGTTNVAIAPGWQLSVVYSGTGTVLVAQNAVAGVSQYPNNPPFTLSITAGANVSGLTLTQTLNNTSDIWSPVGSSGYVASSITLAPLSSITSMAYVPSTGSATTLLTANNMEGEYFTFDATVPIATASSTDTGLTGYVNIVITLPVTGTTTLTNVQVVGVNSNTLVSYDETTPQENINNLFWYYKPLLDYKQTPSYLVGWDFALNPTQPLGPTISAIASGANTSNYYWDNTIIYQSATSGVAVSRATSGAMRVTATNTTQFALVQYLPQSVARKVLNQRACVNIAGLASNAINATVSLWYTTSTLPSCIGSQNSIVLTLDSSGFPATFNGTWVQVPRSGLGNATFTVGTSSTTEWNDYRFNGWDLLGASGANTATFVAIVVGFASLTATHTVDIGSISLQAGDIATRPAPKTLNETLSDCQYYYEMSFNQGTVPVQNAGKNTGEFLYTMVLGQNTVNYSPKIPFLTPKYAVPASSTGATTLYSPGNTSGQIFNENTNTDFSSTNFGSGPSTTGFVVYGTSPSGAGVGSVGGIHWTADCRLGQ